MQMRWSRRLIWRDFLWLAIDGNTGRKLATRIDDRSAKTLRRLMLHLPWDENTIFHTDDYSLYRNVLPQAQHRPTKQHTTTIEARNSRIRQYLARFHRKTKCYAKSHFVTEALLALLPYRIIIRTLIPICNQSIDTIQGQEAMDLTRVGLVS